MTTYLTFRKLENHPATPTHTAQYREIQALHNWGRQTVTGPTLSGLNGLHIGTHNYSKDTKGCIGRELRYSFGGKGTHSGHQFALFVKSLYSLIPNDFESTLTGPTAGVLIPAVPYAFPGTRQASSKPSQHAPHKQTQNWSRSQKIRNMGRSRRGGSDRHTYAYLAYLTQAYPAGSLMVWTRWEMNTNCEKRFW